MKACWTTEHTTRFELIKQIMCSSDLLKHPNFDQPFHLFCDASDFAVGGCLCQEEVVQVNGKNKKQKRVIGYFSKKLTDLQQSYGIPEKEVIAIVKSLLHFRVYIWGYKTVVYTDQASAVWLLKKEVPNKFLRYKMEIASFEVDIVYVKGSKNPADWSSRYGFPAAWKQDSMTVKEVSAEEQQCALVQVVTDDTATERSMDTFRQSFDRMVEQGDQGFMFNNLWFAKEELALAEGKIFYRNREVIESYLVDDLLEKVHNEDAVLRHQGSTRTLQVLRTKYFWPGMSRDVQQFIGRCMICNKAKQGKSWHTPSQLPLPFRKFGGIHIDLYGFQSLSVINGKKGILTMVDGLTNFVRFIALNSKTTESIQKAMLRDWIGLFGYPEWVHLDGESSFLSQSMQNWLKKNNVEVRVSGSYAHFQNGRAERLNRYLGEQLKVLKQIENEKRWPEYLSFIEATYNQNWVRSIDCSPYFLVFGREPKIPSLQGIGSMLNSSQLQHLEESARQYRLTEFEEIAKHKDFLVGDLVVWKREMPKKFQLSPGPFRLVERTNERQFRMISLEFGTMHLAATEQLRLVA